MFNLKLQYVRLNYFLWAHSYDEEVKNEWVSYNAPEIISKLIKKHNTKTDPTVVDVEIGTGILSEHLKEHFNEARIHGYDASKSMLKKCAEKHITDELVYSDLDNPKLEWPSGDEMADIVMSCGALDHFENIGHFMQQAFRTLKPGGILGTTHLISKKAPMGSIFSMSAMNTAARKEGFDVLEQTEKTGFQAKHDTGQYGFLIAVKPPIVS